jgi:hypothetical protein
LSPGYARYTESPVASSCFSSGEPSIVVASSSDSLSTNATSRRLSELRFVGLGRSVVEVVPPSSVVGATYTPLGSRRTRSPG